MQRKKLFPSGGIWEGGTELISLSLANLDLGGKKIFFTERQLN